MPKPLSINSELATSESATVFPSLTLAPEASNLPVTLTFPSMENESPTSTSAIAPAGVMETMNAAISAYVEYFT